MRIFIITGASRGLGKSLVEQLLDPGHIVLGIARNRNDALSNLAKQRGASFVEWQRDLSNSIPVAHELEAWLTQIGAVHAITHATLINNVGVISPIGPIRCANAEDLSTNIRVGLESALLLTASFLKATSAWRSEQKIMNISSGLGKRPMESTSAYCAAKAGMDHFSRCVALEEANKPNGAKICSIAPGVVATDMQLQMRSTPKEVFPDQEIFEKLYQTHALTSSEDCAKKLLDFVASPQFGIEPIADIRLG